MNPVTEPTGRPARSVFTSRSVNEKYIWPVLRSIAVPWRCPDFQAPPSTEAGGDGTRARAWAPPPPATKRPDATTADRNRARKRACGRLRMRPPGSWWSCGGRCLAPQALPCETRDRRATASSDTASSNTPPVTMKRYAESRFSRVRPLEID
ncbi:hypothetical protein SCALM49S_02920 [Streptomyces californicus]